MRGRPNSLRRNLHRLNGRFADGSGEDSLGQRVYRAMKRIRQEILHHYSTINIFFMVDYTSLLDPPVGVQHLCTRPPCAIKGRRTLEKNSSRRKDLEAEDRLIHRHKSNTALSGRRVLRFGGPNHSKSPSVLVFLLHEKI